MSVLRSAIVAVSTYNCPKYLKGFVESFGKYTKPTDKIEILLDIHNDDPRYNSADYALNTKEFTSNYGVEHHNDGENLFYGGRRNRMISEALSLAEPNDYIFLFDDDIRFTTHHWIPYVMNLMDNFPEVGIMGLHWPRLKDGKTRQAHHGPIRTITRNGMSIYEKKVCSGNSWCCRPDALKKTGWFITAKTREEWKAQSPGPDTEYHNRMLEKTDYILGCTIEDLFFIPVFHSGLDEMR